jgi:hypothetical protein
VSVAILTPSLDRYLLYSNLGVMIIFVLVSVMGTALASVAPPSSPLCPYSLSSTSSSLVSLSFLTAASSLITSTSSQREPPPTKLSSGVSPFLLLSSYLPSPPFLSPLILLLSLLRPLLEDAEDAYDQISELYKSYLQTLKDDPSPPPTPPPSASAIASEDKKIIVQMVVPFPPSPVSCSCG